MVSEIPSDRPIVKTTASSDKTPSPASVRLSRVQAEVSSSVKIAIPNTKAEVKADTPPVADKLSAKNSTTPTTNPRPPTTGTSQQAPSSPPPQQNTPPKALYNATVIFNRQTGAGSTPSSTTPSTTSVATQLTTDVIQRINQGLMTIVRITTDLPLLKGDQLIVNSSSVPRTAPGATTTPTTSTTSTQALTPHLELQQLHSIPSTQRIQQTIINLVRLLVPTQNSYSPLLNNILSLVSGKPELLRQLPPNIQQAIKQISQHLPNTESLRSADTVKQAIKHSGVLFESSLKAGALKPELLNPSALKPELTKSELLKSELLKPEALKQPSVESPSRKYPSPLSTAIIASPKPNPSGTITTNTTTKTNAAPQQSSPSNATHSSAPLDFKHQLLSLEKALLSTAKTTPTIDHANPAATKTALGTHTINDSSKVIQKTVLAANTATNSTTVSTPTSATGTTPGYTAPSEKLQLQNLMQLAKAQHVAAETPNTKHQTILAKSTAENAVNIATPSTNNTSAPLKPLAIQTYQTASSQNTASLQGIPPLPGQYLMQAQTNIKATLKGGDVADALVKILLKQTQESINRLQLHQLSTAAAHVDDGAKVTQAPLSFDLPILHFGQLTLFHFHIEEEAQKNDTQEEKSADKKWNVSMGFDIEGLGAMFCELSLINTYVYVKFWAKERDTVSRAKSYFDVLQKNLSQIGATVKELECIEGLPPQQESSIKPSLIDVET